MKPAPAKSPKDSINFRLGERRQEFIDISRALGFGHSTLARHIIESWMDGKYLNIRKERVK